jgi:glycine cleavage system aminomethyltransferase T
MGWIVKFDKPDFIGKTSLAQLRDDGLDQKLVGFEMAAQTSQVPEEGAAILRDDGYPVGRVTSARHSPVLNRTIGLAWVPVSCGVEGAELRIQLDGATESARVVPVPFYDASGSRMKS